MDRCAYIKQEYDKARVCLWGPEHGGWMRNDIDGYYHLWNAYHESIEADDVDHLLFARILYMMASELHDNTHFSEYVKFHRFAIPMMREFKQAVSSLNKPTEKELKAAEGLYKYLNWVVETHRYTAGGYAQSLSLIEGHELLADWGFGDSMPTYFFRDGDRAILKLDYDGDVATFEFSGVRGIVIETSDLTTDWLDTFHCYKDLNFDLIHFDVEVYKITCESVKVLSVQRADAT